MRILYLCCDSGIPVLGSKGAAIHVREMICAFRRAGHEVLLAAQTLTRNPWEKPATVDAAVIHVRPPAVAATTVAALKDFQESVRFETPLPSEVRRILFNKEISSELKRRCESERPDLIYERASLYSIAGATLARHFDVPLLVELNAPLALEQNTYRSQGLHSLAAAAERALLEAAEAIFPVSSELRKHIVDLGISARKIHVLPNGVDPTLFRPGTREPEVRARLRLSSGTVIGFVGSLRQWHGVEALPTLLRDVAKSDPSVQMIIAGDGPLRASLEAQFHALGLLSQVRFTGALPHEQIPSIIRQFDVAVAPYPPLDHAFYFSPLKLFEYMACGVPVVCSSSGQISEVVKHNRNGLLYRCGDRAALTRACVRLLRDNRLRQRLGHAAWKTVHTGFTWDNNARRITGIAASLLKRQRDSARRRSKGTGAKARSPANRS